MKRRIRYRIDRTSPAAITAVCLMALSAIVRLLWFFLRDPAQILIGGTVVHLLLPLTAAVIFCAVVLFAGETHAHLTTAAVAVGVVFFAVKALGFSSRLHTVLCLILYAAVLLLYSLTLFGILPTKRLLYPLFALPLLYHIFVEDTQLYLFASPPPPAVAWLPEISVLLIMGALLSVSVALQRSTDRE